MKQVVRLEHLIGLYKREILIPNLEFAPVLIKHNL